LLTGRKGPWRMQSALLTQGGGKRIEKEGNQRKKGEEGEKREKGLFLSFKKKKKKKSQA